MSPSRPGNVAGVTSRVYLNSSNICSRVTLGSYTDRLARSSKRSFMTNAAAASRVSPVSFLKAKPKMAICKLYQLGEILLLMALKPIMYGTEAVLGVLTFLPVMVLNMLLTILWAKRRFW